MRAKRFPRGLTLLELLVTTAIASVVIAAAMSVFVALASQQRSAERLVEAQSSSMVALATMQFDVGNAGYRFPLAAFAVRHIQVDATTSLPSEGSNTITTTANCGTTSGGLVEGTDVLELAEGYPLVGPGKALTAGVTGGVAVSFTLGNFGEPFSTAEATGSPAPGVGSVLVFANATGASCLVKVDSLQRTGMTYGTGVLLDRNYEDLGVDPAIFYPGCPAVDMQVYRLGGRSRYMICKPSPSATPNEYALYRQGAGLTGIWNSPVKIQDGIEDLQVSLGYSNADGGIASTGSDPTCIQGNSGASFCYCDDKVSGACSLTSSDLEPALASITPGSRISLVRGIRVQLTGMGQRLATTGGAQNLANRRPDSFNHGGMLEDGGSDNYLRVQQQFSFAFQNLQVVP